MRVHLCLLVVTWILLHVIIARKHRRSTCITHPRLRDKWHFTEQKKQSFIRIRDHQIVFKQGKSKAIKYKCLENQGNVYLLRSGKYKKEENGILCLGFSYVADHPSGEYKVLRLIGPGDGSHLLSPVLVNNMTKLSVASTCNVHSGQPTGNLSTYVTSAFIRRAREYNIPSNSIPGCKFPPEIRGRWNFTYQHAKSLEIWNRNATLHLMNGESVRFLCDKRENGVFVFSEWRPRRPSSIITPENAYI